MAILQFAHCILLNHLKTLFIRIRSIVLSLCLIIDLMLMKPNRRVFSLFIPLLSIFWTLSFSTSLAQGIKGTIKNSDGEPLGYASVFIRNLGDGIPTNQNGSYELKLQKGVYDVLIQYLGYKSHLETVAITDQWVELNVALEPQIYSLGEVEVLAGKEDPALTIMRKAIAKAKYHRLQVQKYSMMVYLKGTGMLTDAPFFMKSKLEKEGLKLNEAYTTESVSKISFAQPNTVKETVISIRTSGDNQSTSPARFIQSSFYQDKVVDIISPLSRQAFQYYKFFYEGSFFDQNVMVSKIKVVPRSRGQQVFEGHIFIVEDLWAIHSLDLKSNLMGFDISLRQQYAPVVENVWMPLSHVYRFGGQFFGFEGEFNYLASTRDYVVTLNPDLAKVPVILDEKIQEIPTDVAKFEKKSSALEQLAKEQPTTRKDYRKLMNEYEKESLKKQAEPEVVSDRSFEIDTLARKRNLSYWDSIRPVPLSALEIQGYVRDDSIAVIEAAKLSEVDSIAKKARKKFQPLDLMNGSSYSFGKGVSLGFKQNWTKASFNTVEGWKLGMGLFYKKEQITKLADSVNVQRNTFRIDPEMRYGFASNRFYGKARFRWSEHLPLAHTIFDLEGGRYIYQFNASNPINEQVNALYSLGLRQNFMKLYEQDFLQATWSHQLNSGLSYQLQLAYAERRQLSNQSNYSLYQKPGRSYTSNQPLNIESSPSEFEDHEILKLATSLEWRPGIQYGIRNGKKYPITDRSPLITMKYEKAFGDVLGGNAAKFDHANISMAHDYRFGVSGKLDFKLTAGSFLTQDRVYFQDFQHFGGNRTIFSNMGAASNYRLLDYYRFSTSSSYVSSIVHYQFRKFLVTQLPMLRFSGVKENLFLNYLKTEHSPHYWELGYSLDNLYRIFRLEFAVGFENTEFKQSGVRIGIATFLSISVE